MLDKEARRVWVVRVGEETKQAEAESAGDPQSERRQGEEPAGAEKGAETAGRRKGRRQQEAGQESQEMEMTGKALRHHSQGGVPQSQHRVKHSGGTSYGRALLPKQYPSFWVFLLSAFWASSESALR